MGNGRGSGTATMSAGDNSATNIGIQKISADSLSNMQAVSDKQREYAENRRKALVTSYNQYVDAYESAMNASGTAKEQLQARINALDEFSTHVDRRERFEYNGENYGIQSLLTNIRRSTHKTTKGLGERETESAYREAIKKADEYVKRQFKLIEEVLRSNISARDFLDGKW